MSVGHAPTTYAGSGKNQVRSFLAARFAHEPGTSFAYNISASHMLSHIITKVSGVSIYEYLKPRLLDPLGIEDVVWEMDNDGINMGNGGTHMKTSDMAKMGLFLLNKGKWNGKQLLNSAWIEAATTPHIYQHPERTQLENENAADLSEADLEFLKELVKKDIGSKESLLNSSSLVVLLDAYKNTENAFIGELPLELALIKIIGQYISK